MGCECVVLWETEEDFEKALLEEGRKIVRGLAVEYHIRDVAGLNMVAEWGSHADRPAAFVSGGWRVVWGIIHFQLPGRDADFLD